MSLIIGLTNGFDFGANKYFKLLNKITHGYKIRVNNKNSSEIQYAIFFKGFNSLETTNLMFYFIQEYPFIKVLNMDFDYGKYLESNLVDTRFKIKITQILAHINSKYWHFNLPDFDNDLFEEGNTDIIDSYLNDGIVELVNFIKVNQDSLSDVINSLNLPLLLFLNNYSNDFTFNHTTSCSNDDPFFKINSQTFLKSNYKNVKLTINFYKYFFYLNKKILKKNIYNVQFCSTKHTDLLKIKDFFLINKLYNQFRNYDGEINIKQMINTRKWLFKQQNYLLQQFWKSLEMEYPYKSQENFSIKDPFKFQQNDIINLKFLTIKSASDIYFRPKNVILPIFGVMSSPSGQENDNLPMNKMEVYQTKRLLKFLMTGTHGEIYIYSHFNKISQVLKEHWQCGIHDEL